MAHSVVGILCVLCYVTFGSSFLTSSCTHASFRVRKKSSASTLRAGEGSYNYLSHIHLRVSHVNATMEYWVEDKGAVLQIFRQDKNSSSAFIGYGPNQSDPAFLSLELIQLPTSQPIVLGNVISYIGLSMLMKYDFTSRRDINQLIEDKKAPPPLFSTTRSTSEDVVSEQDPNCIPIKYVASAPGDSLSRFCLRCTDLDRTSSFYSCVFGMKVVAKDEHMVCLRFPHTGQVPTTLVFEACAQELEHGNCFDHLVVGTNDLKKVEDLAESFSAISMRPRPMFGATVMGLTDPNGYKVYVSQRRH